MTKRIAVTGGAGFVGSHVVGALLAAGHRCLVVDDLRMGVHLSPPSLLVAQTVGRDSLKAALADVEAVIHCAAHADVSRNWESREERRALYGNNIEATTALLEEIPEAAAVVFLSTCAVYGDSNGKSVETDVPPQTSPYSASKLAGEALVQAYAHARGTPWHAFRLSCVVGSGYHHGHVADMVASMRRDGCFRAKNDGLTKKSFVHADDVADACFMAIDGRLPSGTYNLATEDWSWRDTFRVMKENAPAGQQCTFEAPESRMHGWIGDPMAIGDATKARAAGWVGGRSVVDGVRETLAFLGWKR